MANEETQCAHKINKKGEIGMKKICYFLSVITLLVGAVGCQNLFNDSSSSSVEISSLSEFSSDIEDSSFYSSVNEDSSSFSEIRDSNSYWPSSDAKCHHRMTSIDEYRTFYSEFIKYNEERYFMPIIGLEQAYDYTLYHFEAKDVVDGEFENGKYGVEYTPEQKFRFTASIKDYQGYEGPTDEMAFPNLWITGQCYNIAEDNFDFFKEKITLTSVNIKYQPDGTAEEHYVIQIRDKVICDFYVYWWEWETLDLYKQEFSKWIEQGGYVI
ncbi:MAG: hypothetical protein J6D30_01950 [Clostridia bacterium]|nr:hypothetical protein [Clostridia bacterium]